MSQLYTIRKLEWREVEPGLTRQEAQTPGGVYAVWFNEMTGLWKWRLDGNSHGLQDTIAAAKLAAEAHWHDRIKQALVPVTVTTHDGSGQ